MKIKRIIGFAMLSLLALGFLAICVAAYGWDCTLVGIGIAVIFAVIIIVVGLIVSGWYG